MKSLLLLLFIVMTLFSCKKERLSAHVPLVSIWGCWQNANTNSGSYDIILTERVQGSHSFQFAEKCTPVVQIPSLDIGAFRGDTLIFDNGSNEYWVALERDTLFYGAYVNPSINVQTFVKQ